MNQQALSSFIWSVADLLRGDYKQSEYGKVILPLTVLRRLDCVLEDSKSAVLAEFEKRKSAGVNLEPFLKKKSGLEFYNTCPMDLKKLMGDPDHIKENLYTYIQAFSEPVRDIFDKFDFYNQIDRLAKAKLLYLVVEKFANVDLHPDQVTNAQMGLAFEELIRKFAELSNETAGEHFTPREVIRLMVDLIFTEDEDDLGKPNLVRTLYDPTAGTGGMLSVAEEHLSKMNKKSRLVVHGQELNAESYAICKADMLIKGQDIANIIFGNTLSDDGLPGKTFDYMLSNPPFGVKWDKIKKQIVKEHEQQGFNGRFGPGLPRIKLGELLFLLHLISKMRPAKDGGSRFGIILNGASLFIGSAGTGESEIRRYLLENDLLEAVIQLPSEMFFNTPITTYIWIISNRKDPSRRGQVQLINASDMWQKIRNNLGDKRRELSDDHIYEIVRLFGNAQPAERDGKPISLIFRNEDFGYRTITVERPERDKNGKIAMATKGKQKGKPQADSSLRDTENVPLTEDIDDFFEREVLPHVPDAWVDYEKTKIGYEIPFNRYFFKFNNSRELFEIDEDIKNLANRIRDYILEIEHLSMEREIFMREVANTERIECIRLEFVTTITANPIDRIDEKIYVPIGLYNRGRGIFHKEPTVGRDLGDSTFFEIREDDFVLSGQFAWEGAIALASKKDNGCIASHRYPILRAKREIVEPAYLFAYFQTDRGQLLLDDHSRGAAGRNRPLNSRTLLKEKIPIPPIPLQQKIGNLVRLETPLRKAVEKTLQLLKERRRTAVHSAINDGLK